MFEYAKYYQSPSGNRYRMIYRQWYRPTYQLRIGNFFSVEFQCLRVLFKQKRDLHTVIFIMILYTGLCPICKPI